MSFPQLLSGFSTMTALAVNTVSDKASVNREGITVNIVYEIPFTGLFSSLALQTGATLIGLPIYGELVGFAGSFTYSYCSNVAIDLAPGATPNPALVTTDTESLAIYAVTFSPLTSERHDLPPLSRPPQFSGGGSDLSEVRNKDVNDKPIVNSAKQYYENLPAFAIPGGEVVITRNEASNPSAIAKQFSNTVNTNAFFGEPALSVLMGRITYESKTESYSGSSVSYYVVRYPLRSRTDTNLWNYAPLDYGWSYLKSGTLTQYVSPEGVHCPIFLDGSGAVLGGVATPTSDGAVVFPAGSGSGPGGYQIIKDEDWSALSLPNPY